MSTSVAESPLSPAVRWRVVALLMAFAALGHFNRVGISVAGSEVFIPKLGLSETGMGWVYTAFLIVYTLGMLPGGWSIDRIGSAQSLTIYGLTMGGFVVLTGALGWLTSRPESLWVGLLVIRGCAGLCNAPLHPAAAHVVYDLVPLRSRATANGTVIAGAVIGIAFSYPAFGWLIDRMNWPLAFVVSGFMLIGYSLLWRRITLPITHGSAWNTASVTSSVTEVNTATPWDLLWNRNLWLLSLSYAAYGYFQYLFFYWMDYYFKSVLHVPDVEARWASFWIMLAMGAGMAVGGMSTDFVCQRLGNALGRRSIVIFGMGFGAVFGLLGVNVTGQINVAMCLAISMAALGMCEGVFWTCATDIGGKSRGFSGAFMNTGGNVGGLISPVLTPVMAQQMGWPGAITVACLIAALGGAVWFAIRFPERDSIDFN
ncbi:MAG: MFS transporter [Schlesneria sp.]